MGRFSYRLFVVIVLMLSKQVQASDPSQNLALIYSLDCNPKGPYGSIAEKQISTLKNFGWSTHYFCGGKNEKPIKGATPREAPLSEKVITASYNSPDIKNGYNILVTFNFPSWEKSSDENEPVVVGTDKKKSNETQGLLIGSTSNKTKGTNRTALSPSAMSGIISNIENTNPDGMNIIFFESDILFERIIKNQIGSPACIISTSTFDKDRTKSWILTPSPTKEIIFKNIIAQTLKNDSDEVDRYVFGFGLNFLNSPDSKGFIERYQNLLDGKNMNFIFPSEVAANAAAKMNQFSQIPEKIKKLSQEKISLETELEKDQGEKWTSLNKQIETIGKKIETLISSETKLRNELLSLALTQSKTRCANFSLDRNHITTPGSVVKQE